jgi:hypothetical protein
MSQSWTRHTRTSVMDAIEDMAVRLSCHCSFSVAHSTRSSLLLGALPPEKDKWEDTARKSRTRYYVGSNIFHATLALVLTIAVVHPYFFFRMSLHSFLIPFKPLLQFVSLSLHSA